MKQLTTVLKYALLLSISGALMWYAVRGQDLSRIGHYIRTANYFWLGLTIALSVLGYAGRCSSKLPKRQHHIGACTTP
jgi:hypothetical protein